MSQHELQVALKGYCGVMYQGSAYDLQSMLRLVQLWLSTSDLQPINDLMAAQLPV